MYGYGRCTECDGQVNASSECYCTGYSEERLAEIADEGSLPD